VKWINMTCDKCLTWKAEAGGFWVEELPGQIAKPSLRKEIMKKKKEGMGGEGGGRVGGKGGGGGRGEKWPKHCMHIWIIKQ
jgi:hypothetical protein